MSTEHGITLDEQIRWLGNLACGDLRMAAQIRRGNCARDIALDPAPWEAECREEAAMLLAIENTLRAAQVSAVSPPPSSPAAFPSEPEGPEGFYPGD